MRRNEPQEEFGQFPGCWGLNAKGLRAIGYWLEILRPEKWRVGPRSERPDYRTSLDAGRSSGSFRSMMHF